MSGKFSVKKSAVLACSAIMLTLPGCTQMTKHSNTLVFTTNTFGGIKVGTDEKQVPMVQLGYSRQELAWVPVLANTGKPSEGGDLVPCSTAASGAGGQGGTADTVADCKFVGTHDGKDQDSYSTLASFGAKAGVDTSVDGKTGVKASVAQYFATGIAAQYLAISGGANVVSAGGDSKAKAEAASNAAFALTDMQRANAEKFQGDVASGEVMARSILGAPGAAVADDKLTALAGKIGYAACDVANLKTFNAATVDDLIKALKQNRRPCLAKLGREATNGGG